MSPPDSSEPRQPSDPEERSAPRSLTPQELSIPASVPPAAIFGEKVRYQISSRDDPATVAHIHQMELVKEQHRQQMEVRNWWATVILVGVLVLVCASLAAFHPNVELQKLAAGGLLSLFTAWLGYAVGRAQSKSGS